MSCFHCLGEFVSFLQGSSHTPLRISRSMFSQIVVGTRNNFVIDLADFGMQTEKSCPPLCYNVVRSSCGNAH